MVAVLKPYTKIRVDGSGIPDYSGLGADAAVRWFERETLGVLREIALVWTGQVALRYIQTAHFGWAVTIRPYTWGYIKKAFPHNPGKACFNAVDDADDDGGAHSGDVGSSATVHFNKWNLTNRQYMRLAGVAPWMPGIRPDELLFHELLHSLRDVTGKEDHRPTGDLMVNLSEFFSILVANIYSTDPTNPHAGPLVRRDHHGADPLFGRTRNLSEEFLATRSYRTYVEHLVALFPDLAMELALVPACFNPIRQFVRDRKKGARPPVYW
jgi:hypothetical protein